MASRCKPMAPSRASNSCPTRPENSAPARMRSEEHTSELQSLMRISYAVFCLKKKRTATTRHWQKTDQECRTYLKTTESITKAALYTLRQQQYQTGPTT